MEDKDKKPTPPVKQEEAPKPTTPKIRVRYIGGHTKIIENVEE
jgi:hypothetical protein